MYSKGDKTIRISIFFVILHSSCWYEKDTEDVAPTDYVGPVCLIVFCLKSQLHIESSKSYIDLLKELVSFAFAQFFITVVIKLKSFTSFTQ